MGGLRCWSGWGVAWVLRGVEGAGRDSSATLGMTWDLGGDSGARRRDSSATLGMTWVMGMEWHRGRAGMGEWGARGAADGLGGIGGVGGVYLGGSLL